jgi:radical SAM superfamily enzyme YgiQ (UPF0313 family)
MLIDCALPLDSRSARGLIRRKAVNLDPDRTLHCLLINPEFRGKTFWDLTATLALVGAKAASPPLGLLTVAALLPQHWQFSMLDLNVRPLTPADWQWADLICTGGMLPQQQSLREIIERAVDEAKYVVVGGADPSSQPHLYRKAHTVVVGEGEEIIPRWLDAWRAGRPYGVFKEESKPDVTMSPTPRFDLLDLADYGAINIQYSRGCPFNCEFCDIIELYGRKPRVKTPQQLTKELDAVKALGYTGEVFIVDDNFIGNKGQVTRHLLPALIEWNRQNRYPFYYTTEASLNLMDDDVLMAQMKEAEFQRVFFGIETPDPEVLKITQKRQNVFRPILQRLNKLYAHGMVAFAGFILGLDGEKGRMDQPMIQLIEDSCINIAMVGFLVALPNTQLTRRLLRQGRLISAAGEIITTEEERLAAVDATNSVMLIVDQTVAGLNFRTDKDRLEIIYDFMNVISAVYEPKSYFERLLRLTSLLKCSSRHRPGRFQLKRELLALMRLTRVMHGDRTTRRLFWRVMWAALRKGTGVFAQIVRLIAMYVHLRQQARYSLDAVKAQLPIHEKIQHIFVDSPLHAG